VEGEPVLPVIGLTLAGFLFVIGLIWWSRRAHRAEASASA
jgi:hypothetical protein